MLPILFAVGCCSLVLLNPLSLRDAELRFSFDRLPSAKLLLPSHLMPPSNLTHVSSLFLCPRLHDMPYVLYRKEERERKRKQRLESGGSVSAEEEPPGQQELADDWLLLQRNSADWREHDETRSDWAQLNISQWNFLRSEVDSEHQKSAEMWVVHEVAADPEQGEILLPLWHVKREDYAWGDDAFAFGYFRHNPLTLIHAWKLLLEHGLVTCRLTYGTGSSSFVEQRAASFCVERAGSEPAHISCPLKFMHKPNSLTVRISTVASELPASVPPEVAAEFNILLGDWSGELVLPLCQVWQRRVHTTVILQPVFGRSLQLKHFADWVDYHRRIGVDSFLIPDRSGWLLLEADRVETDVHAGRLQAMLDRDIVHAWLWPQLPFVGTLNMLNIDRQ
jgi:hypothetical protein